MKHAAYPSVFKRLININRCFHSPVICRSFMERTCICISKQSSFFLSYKVRVFSQSVLNPGSKFFCGGNIIFKGDGCIFYIWSVNFKQCRRICSRSGTDYYFIVHDNFLSEVCLKNICNYSSNSAVTIKPRGVCSIFFTIPFLDLMRSAFG